ncbi:MAG: EAL domain-containing protein [Candidatus Krumholzibacteria bacterium]|nr:EAL domain-containing protein [Candidatus Krumholzibacteria bacterium]
MSPDVPVCRLLFVHRDPALADRIRGLLGHVPSGDNESGFRVAHLTHLTDAFTYLKISPVDLVLVGPDPAGSGLVESIAELSAIHPEIPIVALLTSPTNEERNAVRKAGARECLSADEFDFQIWTRTFEFCRREMTLSRELAQVTARLDWLVHMDSLTDLLNRKGMERAIMEELARCRRDGDELLILLVDLDDFSRVNATMGHGVGDLVLVGAARRIKESVRDQDMVGRCGTDRFVIMLPETEVAVGEVIAEKIRLAVSRDVIKAGGESITTTASLGLTAISPTSLSFDEVLAKAHFVLQRSKLKGKNRVARAASLEEVGMIRPVTAGPEMVRALLRGNVLEVSSQPIVNLSDGRIVSREMLIRGPEGPLRRPDHLFSFCQENDITTAVDLRCLKLCAAAAGRLGANGHFHVNIMPATLLQTESAELIRVLSGNGTDGQCCLEISEQQLLGDPSVLVPRVQAIQKAGIRIAIDDVGFGNSCLEGLIMLHPQVMKIDKRLVRGLAVDPEMRKALARLLKVADVLEAEVVAEGIENTEDYHILLDMGVRLGQGYLFGRPCMCSLDPVLNGNQKPKAKKNGARAKA